MKTKDKPSGSCATPEEAVERFGVVIDAFCLMANHYHLLLQTPRGNLSDAAGWLQATYRIRFSCRHGRSGHLFQGRFKAHLIEADSYARRVIKLTQGCVGLAALAPLHPGLT